MASETDEQREQRRREHVESVRKEQRQEAGVELDAMAQCLDMLLPLPKDSQKRALRWVADRLDNFREPGDTFFSDEPPF